MPEGNRKPNGYDENEALVVPRHYHSGNAYFLVQIRGALLWVGRNIFPIIGLLMAVGVLSIPASRGQLEAVSKQVETVSAHFQKQEDRITAVEQAQAKNEVWHARAEEKLDRLLDAVKLRLPSQEASIAPSSPPPPFPPSSLPSKHPKIVAGKKEKTGQSSLFGLFAR